MKIGHGTATSHRFMAAGQHQLGTGAAAKATRQQAPQLVYATTDDFMAQDRTIPTEDTYNGITTVSFYVIYR